MLRLSEDRIAYIAIDWVPESSSRKRGRLLMTWRKTFIENKWKLIGMMPNQLRNIVPDDGSSLPDVPKGTVATKSLVRNDNSTRSDVPLARRQNEGQCFCAERTVVSSASGTSVCSFYASGKSPRRWGLRIHQTTSAKSVKQLKTFSLRTNSCKIWTFYYLLFINYFIIIYFVIYLCLTFSAINSYVLLLVFESYCDKYYLFILID